MNLDTKLRTALEPPSNRKQVERDDRDRPRQNWGRCIRDSVLSFLGSIFLTLLLTSTASKSGLQIVGCGASLTLASWGLFHFRRRKQYGFVVGVALSLPFILVVCFFEILGPFH